MKSLLQLSNTLVYGKKKAKALCFSHNVFFLVKQQFKNGGSKQFKYCFSINELSKVHVHAAFF